MTLPTITLRESLTIFLKTFIPLMDKVQQITKIYHFINQWSKIPPISFGMN